jgi:hypothetical protein
MTSRVPANETDFARRAKELYNARLRPELERTHYGQFCAIDPDSGEHFLGPSMIDAMTAGRTAHPDRKFFLLRIGPPIRIGMIGG